MRCRCSSRQRAPVGSRLEKVTRRRLTCGSKRGASSTPSWGRLRDLSALEMAALLPVAGADVRFRDGERTPNRTLDLSAIDVTSRMGEVSRAGGGLAKAVPGIEAVPRQTGYRRGDRPGHGAGAGAGRRYADRSRPGLGRQPLAVVRALANLAQQGAVTFGAAEIVLPQPPAPLTVVPPPAPPPVAEDVEANVVDTTASASRRFPVNMGLAVLRCSSRWVCGWPSSARSRRAA